MPLYHTRLAETRVLRMAELFPVVCLLGARQVGKSTLLAHLLGSKAKAFVFDPLDDLFNARRDPELFLSDNPPPLILDEVQYAPELLPAIKRRVDRQPEARGLYFLTGSQNLAVLKDVAESMAGRAGILELPAMTLAEWIGRVPAPSGRCWLERWFSGEEGFSASPPARVAADAPLSHRMWTGLMPKTTEARGDSDIADIHRSHVMTYLERDVRRAGNIEHLDEFRRFLAVMAALTGQELNLSQLGRDVGISRLTAQKWLAVLGATYQWIQLPAYHGNTIKRLARHDKGYFHDTGLACFLQRLSSSDAVQVSPLRGALFETYAATGILKLATQLDTPPSAYHWRSAGGAEVDLLLERDGRLWPFEFKAGTHITGHDARGIAAFRATYPDQSSAPGAVIAPVSAPYRLAPGTWVLPYDLQ